MAGVAAALAADTVARLIAGRPRITVITADDLTAAAVLAQAALQAVPCAPVWFDPRRPLVDLVAQLAGAGDQPDPAVAKAVVAAAAATLSADRPAESLTERDWEIEGSTSAEISCPLVQQLLRAHRPDAVVTVQAALSALAVSGISLLEQFQQVQQLLIRGFSSRPVVVELQAAGQQSLGGISSLVQLHEWTPQSRLLLLASTSDWLALRSSLDAHTQALLADGWVDLATADGATGGVATTDIAIGVAANDGVIHSKTEPGNASIVELRERATEAVKAALATGMADGSDDVPTPQESLARSLAEALLHAALQADVRTSGLFQLNLRGDFNFGPRPVEIDLCCRDLRIAVEVDGYFHFQNKQAYRRDRSKDFLLQQHGYWVLRFLAEDVTAQLEAIVERIATVVIARSADGASNNRPAHR